MSTNRYKYGIFIFRRDFRIADNTGLMAAFRCCERVIPIFIFTKTQVDKNDWFSSKSFQFLLESLDDLDKQMWKLERKKVSRFYDFGNEDDVLNSIINTLHDNKGLQLNNVALFCNLDYTEYSKERDNNLEIWCKHNNIKFKGFHDICLHEPGTILTNNNEPYRKFTPFYEKYMTRNVPSSATIDMMELERIRNGDKKRLIHYEREVRKGYFKNKGTKKSRDFILRSLEYISTNDTFKTKNIQNDTIRGGRKRAILDILFNINKWSDYENNRDNLNYKTTRLSAYLKYGCVSPREVVYAIMREFRNRRHPLIRQLVWRDFYIHVMNAFPNVVSRKRGIKRELKQSYSKIKWRNSKKEFERWKTGTTGFPIVDACMRELNETGFMHNRGRMIVASFLVKTLLCDWEWGEKYFATKLVDYDPAANNGNWQWVSGTGADSMPYFRIFNPWIQAEKYDPNTEYIHKWIPELKYVISKDIHSWDMKKVRKQYINFNYPEPIVDYRERRKMAIDMYKKSISS
jgi:deoxyribodipyrimidine photo-lyase